MLTSAEVEVNIINVHSINIIFEYMCSALPCSISSAYMKISGTVDDGEKISEVKVPRECLCIIRVCPRISTLRIHRRNSHRVKNSPPLSISVTIPAPSSSPPSFPLFSLLFLSLKFHLTSHLTFKIKSSSSLLFSFLFSFLFFSITHAHSHYHVYFISGEQYFTSHNHHLLYLYSFYWGGGEGKRKKPELVK